MKRAVLTLVVGCFLLSIFASDERLSCAAGLLMLAIIALHDRRALTAFGSFRLWIFPLTFIVLSPLCMGDRRCILWGLRYSPEQIEKGALFLFHAYCFVVFGAYVSRAFAIQEVVRIAERIGIPQMGLKVALGMGAAKILSRMVSETHATYRMTRPGWAAGIRECHILLGAIVRNAILVAERISILFYIRNVKIGREPADVGVTPLEGRLAVEE